MRKLSSGLEVGLWATGVLVALYLLGFATLVIDLTSASPHFPLLPEEVQAFIVKAYWPLGFRVVTAP